MKFYHLTGPAPLCTNSFLLISDAGSGVIIDPAADAGEYNALLRQNKAHLAVTFCTHGHYDHVGSAHALRSQWGARLYCEPADTRGDQYFPLPGADSGYAEGETIPVDELNFRVWHTPGHSKGSVCLLCGNDFFTGDTLFHGDTGRTDLPGGSMREMVASCKKLMRLPVPQEARVLPGHEEFSTYGTEMRTNAFILSMCE